MKPRPLMFKSIIYGLLFVFVLFPSCSKDNPEDVVQQETFSINDYLKALNYNSDELLGVENTGSDTSLKTKGESTDSNDNIHGTNTSTTCTSIDYNLKTNFSDIPILDPNKGIIWPGALVYGDASLKRGMPTNINIDRAPMTLRIDLPGIGEAGNVTVESPKNSETNAAIDVALEWWNANAYREGYVNPSNSDSEATTLYSKQQMSLELGLNAEWITGNVSSEFDYETTKEKRVAMMVYKQVFYTISMDQPLKPSDVFGESVSVGQVQDIFNAQTPAAYIHNVSYGRIIMFRMETTAEATDIELKAAFEYATGKNKVDGDLEVKAKSILEQSSIKTFAIGGNAASTAELVSARNFADLEPVIKGENAIYSRENPGVPISYTVRYLKDNTLAKMGFNTNYTAVTCFSTGRIHPGLEFNNHTKNDGFRIGLTYKNNLPGEPSQSYADLTSNRKWKKNEVFDSTSGLTLPNGAYDVRIYIELQVDDKDGSGSGGKIDYWHVDENYKQRYFKKELGNYIQDGGNGLYDKCYIAEKKWLQPVTVRALKCP